MAKSPAAILYDESGNPVGVVLDGSIYRLQTEAKLATGHGLATEATLGTLATESTLQSIRDISGIKKITDPLPAGTNNIGDVDVVSSALPVGAATETTLATRLSEATFTGRINTLGQKVMTGSTPVVLASDHSAVPVTAAGISDFVDQDQIFYTSIQVNTSSSSSDNPLLYLKNPSGNTQSYWVCLVQAGTIDANTSMIYKIFGDPTISANGTPVPITNGKLGGPVSAMQSFSLPTVTANGSLLSSTTQGPNSNMVIPSSGFSIRVDPNHSLLVTGKPSINNRESFVTVLWREALP